MAGHLKHDDLLPFWKRYNVGVSFVPVNEIYAVQPPTKTFEYLLAGMPVIATGTSENRRVVSEKNGLIVKDTAETLFQGLQHLYAKRKAFSLERLR